LKTFVSKIFGKERSRKRQPDEFDDDEEEDENDDGDEENQDDNDGTCEVNNSNGEKPENSSPLKLKNSAGQRQLCDATADRRCPLEVPEERRDSTGTSLDNCAGSSGGAPGLISAATMSPSPSLNSPDECLHHYHHHRHHHPHPSHPRASENGVPGSPGGAGVAHVCYGFEQECPTSSSSGGARRSLVNDVCCGGSTLGGGASSSGSGSSQGGMDCGVGGAGGESISSMAASFPALPPPKRKRPARVIEEAEDWCETDANWKDIQYTWTINSFSKCQEELGNYVTSPEFPSNLVVPNNQHGMMHHMDEELAFYLKVHLKGENEDSDHLAVYIVCKGPEEVLASFELSIIVDGKKMNSRDSKKVCQFAEDQHPAWGFKKFITFDELQNEEKGYLKGDRLKLHCEVKFVVVKNLRPVHVNWGDAVFKPENRVEEGMERLDVDQLWRDRKLYADVTIVCQDQEIPANRVLLATRSEVFRAMLSHPTKEARSGRIEILDADATVIEQMLAYIYTGFAPNVEAIAEDLLIAANKYALEELKTDCVRVLESNLSVDNVLEMLVLGDQHEAGKLKDAAVAFLVNRLDVFMDKTFKISWQKFKEAQPDLTTETVKVLLEKQPVAKFP